MLPPLQSATPTASDAPHASPMASDPTAGIGINAPTPAGATAFAKFYFGQIERAFVTGDPGELRRLSLPTCKTCGLYIASVDRLRTEKEVLKGHFTFTFVAAATANFPKSVARVDVTFDTPAVKRFSASGNLILDQKALRNLNETVVLQRVSGAWIVREIES